MKERTMFNRSALGILLVLSGSAFVGYGCSPDPAELTNRPAGANGDDPSGGGAGTTPDPGGGAITPADLSSRRVRRLTRAEYGNTLKDLLGVGKDYGAALPADAVVNGFDNNADALAIDSLFADTTRLNAEEIAASFDVRNKVPCTDGEACARKFVQSFGAKALRRPVRDDEVESYAKLYAATSSAGFESGIRAIVEAMLQSPSFLYKTELGAQAGGEYALTAYEIASELSYLFWRTMPDDALFQAAASGELTKPEVVAREAARLFDSPRSRAMTDAFVEQWLEIDRLAQAEKDAKAYPEFNTGVRNDMRGETLAFFDAIARDGQGSLATLFNADYSYLTPALAQFYGVTIGQGQAVNGFVKTPTGASRGGILTHGSILTTEATPTAANPVRRGKLVRVRVLCQDVPPPPPGLLGKIPPLDPTKPNRPRFAEHESNPSCAGCHRLLDPIGFGFERFDGVGRLLGGTVDATGEIVGWNGGDGKFDGVRELETKLASSADVQACFVRQWLRYGLGASDTASADAEVDRLGGVFQQGGANVRALVTSLTQAKSFYTRNAEEIPAL
jgi:hypothetical protein